MTNKNQFKTIQILEKKTGRTVAGWTKMIEKAVEQGGLLGKEEIIYFLQEKLELNHSDAQQILNIYKDRRKSI